MGNTLLFASFEFRSQSTNSDQVGNNWNTYFNALVFYTNISHNGDI